MNIVQLFGYNANAQCTMHNENTQILPCIAVSALQVMLRDSRHYLHEQSEVSVRIVYFGGNIQVFDQQS